MQADNLEPELRDLILKPKSKKILRPPNAFMLFARDHRKPLAKKYPAQSNKNISSILGQCWRKVDEATKAEYYRKAKMLEELHRKQYPDYVYSPRIARMQKLARKKKQMDKSGDSNEPNVDEREVLEQTGPKDTLNHGSEKSGEWNYGNSEKKQPSPGYIPNNPQFFPDPEHDPKTELPCTAENKLLSASDVHACPSCPLSTWSMAPVESIAVPCSGRCQEECGARSDLYVENYYSKIEQSEMYDYGPWNRYPDYPYEAPVSSTWNACTPGCQGECSTIHPNDEHSSYSHLSSSQHPNLKNSYYHCNSATPYRNPPYYGHYSDSPVPYMPRRYVPYKTGPKAPSSYFSQSMDYYQNQYQHHFKDYHPKFQYVVQQTDCPPVQETTCPSGYPPEFYDYHPTIREEMTESSNTVQGADSQLQDDEQVKTECDGNEMLDVVDLEKEESNILTEEIVESTNPELGQVE